MLVFVNRNTYNIITNPKNNILNSENMGHKEDLFDISEYFDMYNEYCCIINIEILPRKFESLPYIF